MVSMRIACENDKDVIWEILEPVIRAGETYALPRDWGKDDTLDYWFLQSHKVFVAEDSDSVSVGGTPQIVGTYFMQSNQKGGGSHVANCGYVTSMYSTGKGVAKAMCAHSLEYAKNLGYRSMQYNFVISTNERAVKLWESMGFAIVGTLPEAFKHPVQGFVDVYVMYRHLT